MIITHLIHPSLDRPHSPSQMAYPDPISHFATVYFPDKPTNRQTDRWDRRQLDSMNCLRLIVSNVANEAALQQAEMTVVRWMCDVKLKWSSM